MEMYHLLEYCILFGATPDNSYMFIARRTCVNGTQDSSMTSLHMYQIERSLVMPMWQLVTQHARQLHVDAALVLRAVQSLGVNPWLCCIKRIAHSMHNVYAVTFPSIISYPSNSSSSRKQCEGVIADQPHFVIKVIQQDVAFNKEYSCLQRLKPDYFLGGMPFSQSVVQPRDLHAQLPVPPVSDIELSSSITACSIADVVWWRTNPIPTCGGVLLMKIGQPISIATLPQVARWAIYKDCVNCINKLADEGYHHTDVRLANILRFDDVYQLIDYGEVVVIGDTVNLNQCSEERKHSIALRFGDDGSHVCWDRGHDIEMLVRTLFHRTGGNVPTEAFGIQEGIKKRKTYE
jgi:hypothetical protein